MFELTSGFMASGRGRVERGCCQGESVSVMAGRKARPQGELACVNSCNLISKLTCYF